MKQVLLALSTLVLWSCAEVYYPSDPVVYRSEVIRISIQKVKDKGHRYEVDGRIHNETSQSILVLFGGINCFKGSTEGEPHYNLWIGERYIDMPPGSAKPLKFSCKFAREVSNGKYRLVIKKVFGNPSNDGRTPGKALDENISFEF